MRAKQGDEHTLPFLIEYGNRLEKVLLAQRDVSAILSHNGEIGGTREFFVHSVLKRFLPASVVLGRGEIVDGGGRRSRQQDLLLYRSNFPVIDSLAGSHIYLAEGVLATIEVKSHLDKDEFKCVTSNIESVSKLKVSQMGLQEQLQGRVTGDAYGIFGPQPEDVVASLRRSIHPMQGDEPLLRTANERIWTYVFAFKSVGLKALQRHAESHGWSDGAGPDCVCVLSRAYGSKSDAPIFTRPPHTPQDPNRLFIEKCDQPLAWLLAHLVWVVARRFRVPYLRPYIEVSASRGTS